MGSAADELFVLIDFGSTYTKLTAVDCGRPAILGVAQAPTTVETNIMIGFKQALSKLQDSIPGVDLASSRKLACSSAAGGLRMVTVGLVPELTAEAARRAALGAGAKLVGAFSYKLAQTELSEIDKLKPDIILLAGGTDGGNESVILHNASLFASSNLNVPIVLAGNKVVSDQVATSLRKEGKDVRVTENVMPEINRLNIEPAREAIREVFIGRIVQAKGLSEAEREIDGILMPTPAAVLEAAALLAQGADGEKGLGELMVVDVGGATTDVHSMAKGDPTQPGVIPRGLPEPFAKRTVEGDLGIRYNAPTILHTVGSARLRDAVERMAQTSVLEVSLNGSVQAFAPSSAAVGDSRRTSSMDVEGLIGVLSHEVDRVPTDEVGRDLDVALAQMAVEIATERHVGRLRSIYTLDGERFLLYGKDLTGIPAVIGTGGVFKHGKNPGAILRKALYDPNDPTSLRPKSPELYTDNLYIMAAMGLLGQVRPAAAVRLMKENLRPLKSTETDSQAPSKEGVQCRF